MRLRGPEQFYRRLRMVAVTMASLLGALLLRLVWMQVIRGAEFQKLSENNSTRTVPLRAPRGLILDRHLRVLVDNAPSRWVGLIPAELPRDLKSREAALSRTAELMDLDLLEIRQKLEQQRTRPFAPIRLATGVDTRTIAALEERRDQLPGIGILEDSKRSYPEMVGAHALGYVGEIAERQLQSRLAQGYRLGDLIGQTGLESRYDLQLKGEDGGRQVRINSKGREIKVLGETQPRAGNHLVLTLDLNLQRAAETALGQNAGAVVALDPRNGEILALASLPGFDLSWFTGRIPRGIWNRLMKDERTPMSNRALQGLYPPGSVFKVITAAAALETGAVTPHWKSDCLGIYWISTWPYRCWKEIGHGSVALEQAIVESCDIYFYQAGLRTKVDALRRWAGLFGFGELSGIDLPGERRGLVPDAEWKEQTQHMPWFPGNTVMMSIGQGYTLVTPLQLASAVAAIANGGTLWEPHMVSRITSPEGEPIESFKPVMRRQIEMSSETLRLLQRGMAGAVDDRRGTAWRARIEGVSVAGKTGTAQNPHGEDHAAFVTFAPVENPQIAVAVIVENGGEGGLTAAPIARAVMEAYFAR